MKCSAAKPRRISLLAFQASSHSQAVRQESAEAAAGTPLNRKGRERLHGKGLQGTQKSRYAYLNTPGQTQARLLDQGLLCFGVSVNCHKPAGYQV